MANELAVEYPEPVARAALDELYQERWKGEKHALWGEQLSQTMLKHLLHATTMNRDRDPVRTEADVDFGAFDGGPDADEPTTAGRAAADGGRLDGV
jgi:glycerol-3-phosphate dehydrogenase